MRIRNKLWAFAIVGLALLGAGYQASANTIQLTFAGVTVISPTVLKLTYAATLQNSPPSLLKGGTTFSDSSFFTVFDFDGFLPGSASFSNAGGTAHTAAADWVFTSATTGPLPLAQNPPDDGGPNLTWRYQGGDKSSQTEFGLNSIPVFLGLFSANTNVLTGINGWFSGQDFSTDPANPGWQGNTSRLLVPDSSSTDPLVTPTPLASAGGLGLLGLASLSRRRKSAAV